MMILPVEHVDVLMLDWLRWDGCFISHAAPPAMWLLSMLLPYLFFMTVLPAVDSRQ